MSEHPHVHAPQQGIHSWRDFSVHIAVVTIGLLLAIGLQQVVEAVHHRNQRAHLEEQMRETFVANEQIIAENMTGLAALHGYLGELRSAVSARIQGRSTPIAPHESDPRNNTYVPRPGLAAYEASKADGTVALLSLDTIRLYDQLARSIGMVETDFQRYINAIVALRAFAERFESAPLGKFPLDQVDLTQLSREELIEYRGLIGNLLGATKGFWARNRNLARSSRAILDGAKTEAELRAVIAQIPDAQSSTQKAVERR